eukprot:7014544-Pyramimonas_sp.AAC.1
MSASSGTSTSRPPRPPGSRPLPLSSEVLAALEAPVVFVFAALGAPVVVVLQDLLGLLPVELQ